MRKDSGFVRKEVGEALQAVGKRHNEVGYVPGEVGEDRHEVVRKLGEVGEAFSAVVRTRATCAEERWAVGKKKPVGGLGLRRVPKEKVYEAVEEATFFRIGKLSR